MNKTKKIRPIAIALIRHQNKILVMPSYDRQKKQQFYRPLGGGIEFGETAKNALQREIKEELNCGLKNIKLLGCIENIFTFELNDGHEIVFIFEAQLNSKKVYQEKEIKILDSKNGSVAAWVPMSKLKKSRFYPQGIIKYIK